MEIREALLTIEKTFRCHSGFHDNESSFCQRLNLRDRINHVNPCCEYMKNSSMRMHRECKEFDSDMLRARFNEGHPYIFKICQAGVLELALPVENGGRKSGVVFLGPFIPDKSWFAREDLMIHPACRYPDPTVTDIINRNFRVFKESEEADFVNFAIMFKESLEKRAETSALPHELLSPARKIMYFINRDFPKHDFALDSLALSMNLSRSRLSQLLAEHFGKSFPELLNQRRIEYACHLLKETFMRTESIASQCGYSDSPYFFRIFKQLNNGLTPASYRKLNAPARANVQVEDV